MKRQSSFRSLLLAAFMASSVGAGTVAQPLAQANNVSQSQKTDLKGTDVKTQSRKVSSVNQIGGLNLVHEGYNDYGMSPKEYGMRFAHGPAKHKTNRLRASHNKKVSKRRSS